ATGVRGSTEVPDSSGRPAAAPIKHQIEKTCLCIVGAVFMRGARPGRAPPRLVTVAIEAQFTADIVHSHEVVPPVVSRVVVGVVASGALHAAARIRRLVF